MCYVAAIFYLNSIHVQLFVCVQELFHLITNKRGLYFHIHRIFNIYIYFFVHIEFKLRGFLNAIEYLKFFVFSFFCVL